jgi:hypothetical protein
MKLPLGKGRRTCAFQEQKWLIVAFEALTEPDLNEYVTCPLPNRVFQLRAQHKLSQSKTEACAVVRQMNVIFKATYRSFHKRSGTRYNSAQRAIPLVSCFTHKLCRQQHCADNNLWCIQVIQKARQITG